jgi:alpha-amylase/alpha-mannosidase (GH57 family)
LSRYVCIHGHFYQPPRENPWLESIEQQDSAFPFHDWNARITAECYGPNATSRILKPDGKIAGIMNNYSRISFNFGPTLLSWLEEKEPLIYEAILEGDRESTELFSGHGSAIAQAFNHMIMPMANARDKRTQVAWGIEDFRSRFGREPEGMWLPEAAVDINTLETLAEQGIRFTILSPPQAAKVRRIGASRWNDVSGGRVDPRRAYLCRLPSKRSIALFFYDGSISHDIAFGGLLYNGENLHRRMTAVFDGEDDVPRLAHVAVDGETFGHHHKKGEMALSYCLYLLESGDEPELTNYAEFLERCPPSWEVRIVENSSWSCIHGIERWKADCGCNSGMHPGWQQRWRKSLREALDAIRDAAAAHFDREAPGALRDPQGARDRYVRVLLHRTPETTNLFLDAETVQGSDSNQRRRALLLLEVQRHAMLMFTSCGWFFDEISGLEGTQILRYAARVIQLLRELGGPDLEQGFLETLSRAPGNIPHIPNGAEAYRKFAKPAAVDMNRVAVHFAASSLFRQYGKPARIYCFEVRQEHEQRHEAGRASLLLGHATVRSLLTFEEQRFSYAVVHTGDHSISTGLRTFRDEDAFNATARALEQIFHRGDFPGLVSHLHEEFDPHVYPLWHLFSEEQRHIMETLFARTIEGMEAHHQAVFRENYQIMNAMSQMAMPLPPLLKTTVDLVTNHDLQECLGKHPVDEDRFANLLENTRKWSVTLDRDLLGYQGSCTLATLADQLAANPVDFEAIATIRNLLTKFRELGVPLNLWYSQNLVFEISRQQFHIRQHLAREGDPSSQRWIGEFELLIDMLGMHAS